MTKQEKIAQAGEVIREIDNFISGLQGREMIGTYLEARNILNVACALEDKLRGNIKTKHKAVDMALAIAGGLQNLKSNNNELDIRLPINSLLPLIPKKYIEK